MDAAVSEAKSEAGAAFKNDAIFVEKYVLKVSSLDSLDAYLSILEQIPESRTVYRSANSQ